MVTCKVFSKSFTSIQNRGDGILLTTSIQAPLFSLLSIFLRCIPSAPIVDVAARYAFRFYHNSSSRGGGSISAIYYSPIRSQKRKARWKETRTDERTNLVRQAVLACCQGRQGGQQAGKPASTQQTKRKTPNPSFNHWIQPRWMR